MNTLNDPHNLDLIETDVLIAGAGPTGLALATKLHQAGFQPLIVDKLTTGLHTSRAAVIHAHTLEVLQELGVAERLRSHGLQVPKFSIRDRDRTLLSLRFDRLPSRMPYLLMLPQDETERLLNEALEEAGGRVHRGWTVDRLTETPAGIVASISSAEGSRQVRARYVVGADGLHSLVRQTAGIEFTGHNYEESFILADVELNPAFERNEVMLFFSPAGLVVVAPLPNGTFRIVATMDEAPKQPDAADIQALLDARGPSRRTCRVEKVVWGSRFRLQHRVANHYRRGSFFLVGDAAHAHSPAGGQGMNTGLVDACVLGHILSDVLSGAKDESHLDLYETLRRPAAKRVLKLAGGLTRMATAKSGAQRFLRNLALQTINRFPPARHRFEMNLSGLSRRQAAIIR